MLEGELFIGIGWSLSKEGLVFFFLCKPSVTP
jgi:hypothetical protein